MNKSNTALLPRIESRIQVIRGVRVMIDVDLVRYTECRPSGSMSSQTQLRALNVPAARGRQKVLMKCVEIGDMGVVSIDE